jgi:hypothetical protein
MRVCFRASCLLAFSLPVVAAAPAQRRAPAVGHARHVLLIVTDDSAESSAPANETPFNKWLADLPARGIAALAFAPKYRGGGIPDLVAQHVVQKAGGMFDFMNTANELPDKLKALGEQIARAAREMSHWYDVEFETNSDGSPAVEIGVARPGVAIRVSYRPLSSS